jgi:hypothetical protein
MKKLAFAAVLVGAMAIVVAQTKDAWAGCPPGTSYQCSQGYNGKVICGCR